MRLSPRVLGSSLLTTRRSKPNFAGQDFPPETPVAHEAEPGIPERRWFVVLKEEVAGPGECVALDESYRHQPPQLRDQGSDEQCGGNTRTNEVQSAGDPVGMFAEIKRVKIGKATKWLLLAHVRTPSRVISILTPKVRSRTRGWTAPA